MVERTGLLNPAWQEVRLRRLIDEMTHNENGEPGYVSIWYQNLTRSFHGGASRAGRDFLHKKGFGDATRCAADQGWTPTGTF